ncbi:MAG: cytochrome c-type biogenesis protein [Alphaproteobacteria bacterium]|nr:cytochrome c-type biogenesis protein [Alphaproteobacteria bacterium]
MFSFLSAFFFSMVLILATPVHAVEPDEILDDPKLEERARIISKDLRCLVCQNQSIDDSNADLAKDLRVLVRERLVAGDSNEEVLGYITDRYGNYVLLDPPLNIQTIFLWSGPVVIFLVGLLAVFLWFRKRHHEAAAQSGDVASITVMPKKLSDEEEKRLQELLVDTDTDQNGHDELNKETSA